MRDLKVKIWLEWCVLKSDFYTLTPSFKVRILIPLPAYYLTITSFRNAAERFTNTKKRKSAYGDINTYIDTFRETYSDLQSIIILNLSFERYLNSFIEVEGLDVNQIDDRFHDIVRITIVSSLMFDVGVWEDFDAHNDLAKLKDIIIDSMLTLSCFSEDENTSEVIIRIQELLDSNNILPVNNKTIEKDCEDNPELIKQLYPIWCMYDYLANCMEQSLNRYIERENLEEIEKIRKQLNLFKDFNDISLIIEEMNKTLSSYKDHLLKKL